MRTTIPRRSTGMNHVFSFHTLNQSYQLPNGHQSLNWQGVAAGGPPRTWRRADGWHAIWVKESSWWVVGAGTTWINNRGHSLLPDMSGQTERQRTVCLHSYITLNKLVTQPPLRDQPSTSPSSSVQRLNLNYRLADRSTDGLMQSTYTSLKKIPNQSRYFTISGSHSCFQILKWGLGGMVGMRQWTRHQKARPGQLI